MTKMFKIMWLPEASCLWRMQDDRPVSQKLFPELLNLINLKHWKDEFEYHYHKWLNDDEPTIFDLNDPLLQQPIKAITQFNQLNRKKNIYYWYDVDRSRQEIHKWKYCPLSGERLVDLGELYHPKNRKISPVFPLVFPV